MRAWWAILLVGCGSGDEDRDGVSLAKGDCNDLDAEIRPGVDEQCDEVDNDCDGEIDEDPIDGDDFYLDEDDDGYGTDEEVVQACEAPDGFARRDEDCDDDNDNINPGADDTEQRDRNCDGEIEPGDDDDDDDDDPPPVGDGPILAVEVACVGETAIFTVNVNVPVSSGVVYSIDESNYAWGDNHDLEPAESAGDTYGLTRSLETSALLDEYIRNVSTIYPCEVFDDPYAMTYAVWAFDEGGDLVDCVIWGADPLGLLSGDIQPFGEEPDHSPSLCRLP